MDWRNWCPGMCFVKAGWGTVQVVVLPLPGREPPLATPNATGVQRAGQVVVVRSAPNPTAAQAAACRQASSLAQELAAADVAAEQAHV